MEEYKIFLKQIVTLVFLSTSVLSFSIIPTDLEKEIVLHVEKLTKTLRKNARATEEDFSSYNKLARIVYFQAAMSGDTPSNNYILYRAEEIMRQFTREQLAVSREEAVAASNKREQELAASPLDLHPTPKLEKEEKSTIQARKSLKVVRAFVKKITPLHHLALKLERKITDKTGTVKYLTLNDKRSEIDRLKRIAEAFTIKKEFINEGVFGKAYSVKLSKSNEEYIIKKMHNNDYRLFAKEIAPFHFLGSHPNIIGYFGSFLDRTDNKWSIILEKGYKDLYALLFTHDGYSKINKAMAKKIKQDLIAGLEYIHSKGIVHGDLKIENVVMTLTSLGDFRAKLIDFGGMTSDKQKETSNVFTVNHASEKEVNLYLLLWKNIKFMSIKDILSLTKEQFRTSLGRTIEDDEINRLLNIARKFLQEAALPAGEDSTADSWNKDKNWQGIVAQYISRYEKKGTDIFALGEIIKLINKAAGIPKSKYILRLKEENPFKRIKLQEVKQLVKSNKL